MRRVARALALLGTLLPAALSAQQTNLPRSLDYTMRVGLDAPFIAAVQRLGCESIPLADGAPSDWVARLRAGTEPLLASTLGALPAVRAGEQHDRILMARTADYFLWRLLIGSRLLGTETFAYVMEPTIPAGRKPVALLLHGSGLLPHQAFGLRLDQERGMVTRPDSSTFIGLGLKLVRAGFIVVAPVVGTTTPDDRRLQWIRPSLHGEILRAKVSRGGPETFLVPEVQAFMDNFELGEQVRPSEFYLVGWKEGAYIASLTASVDPRVRAVVRLEAPFDRKAFRSSPGMFSDAPFVQADCRAGDVAQASVLRGRPLMYASAVDDASEHERRTYASAAIQDSLRAVYSFYQASDSLKLTVGERVPAVQDSVTAWMSRLAGVAPSTRRALTAPNLLRNFAFEQVMVTERANLRSTYVGLLPACRAIDPSMISGSTNRADVSAAILRMLDAEHPGRERARIVSRAIIDTTRGYRLSRIQYAVGSDLPWQALLAEPLGGEINGSAVLSFNGQDDLDDLFAIKKPSGGEYLNGYAHVLAQRGFVVFVPVLPAWVPDGVGALAAARAGGRASVWRLLIDMYSASLDVMTRLPTVNPTRIAAYGISFGGTAASIMTAVDTRIGALVYSNIPFDVRSTFSTAAGGFTNIWLAEACGVADAAFLLVAPRPMYWEAGEDPLAENLGMDIINRVRRRYRDLGVEENFEFARHSGAHTTYPDRIRIFGH